MKLNITLQQALAKATPSLAYKMQKSVELIKIAENIFDWWISGISYEKWYSQKFLQQKIDFDNENDNE